MRPGASAPPKPHAHLFRVEHGWGGVSRLALHGSLDLGASNRLQPLLRELLPHARELHLDLSAVTFIDSGGVRALLLCRQACLHHACSLALLDPPEQVRGVLARVGLLARLRIIEAPLSPDVRCPTAPDGNVA